MADIGLVDASNPVLKQIDDAATRYGVDRNLAHVVAQMESSYNPDAASHAGAQGVMQLMPATAASLGVNHPFDSSENIDGGVRLLSSLLRKYGGDTTRVLAAYNAGEPAVDRANGIPNFPETQNYVKKGLSILYPRPAQSSVSASADIGLEDAPLTTPKPSALDEAKRLGSIAAGASGLTTLKDTLAGGAKAAMDFLTGNPVNPQDAQQFKSGAGSIVGGIAGEPERMRQELVKSGAAMARGDINESANHLWYSLPFAGAAGAQMAEYLKRGDIKGALAHAAGSLTPVAGEPAIGAAGKVIEAVPEAVSRTAQATGAGIRAAAPDVVAGTAKVGVGVGAHYLPIPAEVKYGIGIPTVGAGARQIGRGLKTGVEAARASFAETAAPEAAAAAQPPAVVETPQLQLPPGPVIPPAPADTSFVRSVPAQYAQPEPIPPSRQLGPGPIIPPPPADASFVRAVPAEYPQVEPGFLGPEVNQMPPAQAEAVVAKARAARTARKPAAAATEPTQPPPATPAAQPPTAADFMRSPGQAYAASEGYDWAKLSAQDRQLFEHIATAQENVATTPAPPPPAAAQPQSLSDFMSGAPATELESQLADSIRAAQEGKQAAAAQTTEAAAPKPENVYVKNARLAKAVRVADAAQQLKLTSRAAYDMITDEARRQKFAEDAGEKSISSDTMAMVVDKLRRREADAARGPAAVPDVPNAY